MSHISKSADSRKTTSVPQPGSKPTHESTSTPEVASRVDWREQMFNSGEIGPAQQIAVSRERIHQVRGIMLDLDPGKLRSSGLLGVIPIDPQQFYERVISSMLARDPVLSRAEVRNSGTGLHALLWLDEPYQCDTDAARDEIDSVADIIRWLLPSDPNQPGITALTRPNDAVNGKNGAVVSVIKLGESITFAELRDLASRVASSPFKTLAGVLFGGDRISPCPFCRESETSLKVMDHIGVCYACGKKKIENLFGEIYVSPKKTNGKED